MINFVHVYVLLVKEECVSEEEEAVKDALVEEILQQGETAIIYPEAPEDEQSPAETGGADENGTTDEQIHHSSFSFHCTDWINSGSELPLSRTIQPPDGINVLKRNKETNAFLKS